MGRKLSSTTPPAPSALRGIVAERPRRCELAAGALRSLPKAARARRCFLSAPRAISACRARSGCNC
jgi:hypothetical protein